MHYHRVYTTAEGRSRFEQVEVDFRLAEFVPGRPLVGLSERYEATGVAISRVPPDWEGDWHPTPRRQFGVVLSGALDIRTSDGQAHRFTPGGLFLLEDTSGDGHTTRTVGDAEAIVLLAWLDKPA